MPRAKLITKLHRSPWLAFLYILVPGINFAMTGEWAGDLSPALFIAHLLVAGIAFTCDLVIFPKYKHAYELWMCFKDIPEHNLRAMSSIYNRIRRGEKLAGVSTIEKKVTIFTFGKFWKRNYECFIHES